MLDHPSSVPTEPRRNSSRRNRPPLFGTITGGIVAIGLFMAIAGTYWTESCAAFVQPLNLQVVFPPGIAGANEPLIATGRFGNADFLTVKYIDADHALLSYDSWGSGGPESQAFALESATVRRLAITMPALSRAQDAAAEEGFLRVLLDGRMLLERTVSFHRSPPQHAFFAQNPIGGTPATVFRGKLFTEDGRPLGGGPAALSSAGERLAWLWRQRAWPLVAAFIASVAIGCGVSRLPLSRWHAKLWRPIALAPQRRPPHRAMIVASLVCAGWFATVMTGGTFRLLYPDLFGSFYDYQAASLLHGRLDVPRAALSGEAFIVDGKCYGYFGVTPAILRMPFVILRLAFGELTRTYLLAYFVACLAAGYMLLCHATQVLGGKGNWPSRWAAMLLVACGGAGSTLFFLGSRAYVYHEAILCGAAFALWSAYFTLRYAEEPARRWWIGAALCGLFAVHARPPAGLFALFLLGCASACHAVGAWRTRTGSWQQHLGVGALALGAMLTFNGMSYLKFRTFDGSPLRYSVQYTPERLAKFDGRNFHVVNMRRNLDTYVLSADIRLERHFPYLFFESGRSRIFPKAKIDLSEPTVALPFSMPGLFILATAGGLWATGVAQLRRPVLLLIVGALPMTLALLTAIVTSHRYTGDFCPFLIATAAFGLSAFDAEPRRWRCAFLSGITVIAALSVFASAALSLQFQGGMVWGVAPEALRNYETLRQKADRLFGVDQR